MAFRKRILLALLFCFCFQFSRAQFVTIPDTIFVDWLKGHGYSTCLIGNQLDTTCNILISAKDLYMHNDNLIDITGVEYFDSVTNIVCDENLLTFLPILPPLLRRLDCSENQIVSLTMLPPLLTELICVDNQLVGLPTLPSLLDTINCSYNQLVILPVLPSSLSLINCSYNQLVVLPTLPYSCKLFDCSYNQLISLPSLPDSCVIIDCSNNQLVSLPSLPSTLFDLNCDSNLLVSLPSLPSNLSVLECSKNQLTSLPFLPNSIHQLSCDKNLITSLPILPNSLFSLRCSFNQLTSLPSLPQGLNNLTCNNNFLGGLPNLPSSLEHLYCPYNLINYLPNLPDSLKYIYCGHNLLAVLPDMPLLLRVLVCNNNQLLSLPALPDTMGTINVSNNFNLTCLPKMDWIGTIDWYNVNFECLPNNLKIITSHPNFLANKPYCDLINLNNCEVFWNIKGAIFTDNNFDCLLDSNEVVHPNVKVNLYSNGSLLQQTYSNINGEYLFDVDSSLYHYSVDTTNLPFIVDCPAAVNYTSNLNTQNMFFEDKDFSLNCKPGIDLGVHSIVNLMGTFRPGDFTEMSIATGDISKNYGVNCNANVAGNVKVIINGPASYAGSVLGAIIPVVVGDTLIFQVANFSLSDFYNDFRFLVQTDTLAQLNDKVCFNIFVTPVVGDNNSANNYYTHCFTVVNSYDPNDKQVSPSGLTDTSLYDLTYTIRFQNTGNAPAQHVYVLDTLDQNIDESSFQLLAYSHEPQTQIIGKRVRFNFPNINLPDSVNNEPESHGFVQYRVKRKNNLPIGTQIQNTAYIYFDFNAPVQTNTTTNEIGLTSGVGVGENQNPILFSIFPNPITSGQLLNIHFNSSEKKKAELSVYDLSGRKLYAQFVNASEQSQTISLPNISPGVYVVVLNDGKHTAQQKLVVLK